ncbi:MAG: AmmeMemoRadiSam system protein B [Desulfitobacterium sp.]
MKFSIRFNTKPTQLMISLILCCFLLLLVSACSKGAKEGEEEPRATRISQSGPKAQKAQSSPTSAIHPSFVTQQELNSILASGSGKPIIPEGRIVSAVLPHHLLAGRLLVDAMEALALQEPNLVILVGPNHFNKGERVISGFSGWQTPEGIMEVSEEAVKHLLAKGLVVIDEEVLAKEHSIGALVPILKHFLPEAEIVPLILHHDVSLKEVDALLEGLEAFVDDRAVLIASVDFSHYLARSEAQAKDQETLRHMLNFDYPALFSSGNDYLDSPASLATAIRLAEQDGIREFDVLDNTNSGIILRNDFIETTSYFTLVFTENL